MDRIMIKKLIDTCFDAKKVTETMPKLPEGLKPRHIHVIDCIVELGKIKDNICVSDVSSTLNITTPSVTKLINELYEKKVINKYSGNDDKRFVSLSLSHIGEEYYKKYVVDYHNILSERLNGLTDEQCKNAIEVIEKLYQAVKNC